MVEKSLCVLKREGLKPQSDFLAAHSDGSVQEAGGSPGTHTYWGAEEAGLGSRGGRPHCGHTQPFTDPMGLGVGKLQCCLELGLNCMSQLDVELSLQRDVAPGGSSSVKSKFREGTLASTFGHLCSQHQGTWRPLS